FQTHLINDLAFQIMIYLKMHDFGFAIGLIFFGIHLICLGVLLQKIKRYPRLIVWILGTAGVGYVFNSFASLFTSENEFLQTSIIIIFILPMTIAELLTGLWLWIKQKK